MSRAAVTSTTSRPKRPKKVKPPASLTAHRCAILAVDPGETSGWSIWANGQLRAYGTCDVFGAVPSQVITRLLEEFGPHMAVVERPFMVRFGSQTNIGTADRIWRKRLEEARLHTRTIRVYPATWRARTLGHGWAAAKRDAVHVREGIVSAELSGETGLHPDAAAAVCIGRWACFAGEVAAKMPKARTREVAA